MAVRLLRMQQDLPTHRRSASTDHAVQDSPSPDFNIDFRGQLAMSFISVQMLAARAPAQMSAFSQVAWSRGHRIGDQVAALHAGEAAGAGVLPQRTRYLQAAAGNSAHRHGRRRRHRGRPAGRPRRLPAAHRPFFYPPRLTRGNAIAPCVVVEAPARAFIMNRSGSASGNLAR